MLKNNSLQNYVFDMQQSADFASTDFSSTVWSLLCFHGVVLVPNWVIHVVHLYGLVKIIDIKHSHIGNVSEAQYNVWMFCVFVHAHL